MRLKSIASRLIKSERGAAGLLELLVGIMVVFALTILVLSIISVGTAYTKLATAANTIATEATASGQAQNEADTASDISTLTGIKATKLTCTWDAQYFDQSAGKLAFRQPYSITVTTPVALPFSFGNGGAVVTVPVTYVARGVSGVYWK